MEKVRISQPEAAASGIMLSNRVKRENLEKSGKKIAAAGTLTPPPDNNYNNGPRVWEINPKINKNSQVMDAKAISNMLNIKEFNPKNFTKYFTKYIK